MEDLVKHYIAGVWRDDGGSPPGSVNPANGESLGLYVPGNVALADEADAAARTAFQEGTRAASPRLSAATLHEFADRLAVAKDEIADLVVAENGKLRSVAIVAGIIVPRIAPVTLLVRSFAPAQPAGCTAIIEPAAQTPLVHARIMHCLAECPSLPLGVVNSINENGIGIGQTMVGTPDINVISFTGPRATGRKIMEGAGSTLKRFELELGGKASSVLFKDAALDLAVVQVTHGSLAIAGQMCTAVARFLMHEKIADDFATRMPAALKAVRLGPGTDPSSKMGALIDTANQSRLMWLIKQAGDEGRMLPNAGPLNNGAFLTPTLFGIDDVTLSLVQEEVFGPIVLLEAVADKAETVSKANVTIYGLAAFVFTHDHARAVRVSRAIRAGNVWIKSHLRLAAEAETGGYGQSGLGRLHGPEGLNDFLETTHIFMEQGTI